jgi:hypothetical protein
MLERVRRAVGEFLRPARLYREDAGRYWGHVERFDKLERLQAFREPEDPSWQAFAAGYWEDSLRLLRDDRSNVAAEFAEDARSGLASYRVRVVEFPVTAYLQWELHALNIRAECGENIRVVGPGSVASCEADGILPELIFMGTSAMYEVLYDETGVLAGGRKFVDPELVKGCLVDVQALYGQGEDLRSFFAREVAALPPPVVPADVSSSSDL